MLGGQKAALWGIRAAFHATSALLLVTAGWVFLNGKPGQAPAEAERPVGSSAS